MSYLWLHQYRIHLQVTEVVLRILAIIYLFQKKWYGINGCKYMALIVLPFQLSEPCSWLIRKLDIGFTQGWSVRFRAILTAVLVFWNKIIRPSKELKQRHTSNYNLVNILKMWRFLSSLSSHEDDPISQVVKPSLRKWRNSSLKQREVHFLGIFHHWWRWNVGWNPSNLETKRFKKGWKFESCMTVWMNFQLWVLTIRNDWKKLAFNLEFLHL